MITSARALFLLVLFVTAPRVVNACGCYNVATVLEDYVQADLVIIAKMKSVVKGVTPNRFGSDISHATMVVQKVFKGEVKIGDELTFGQGEPVLDCSWQFYENYVGEEYLLYLYRPEKPSEPFYVSTCNRSTSVAGATDDLLYLNNIDKLRGRTRISGVIEADGGDDEDSAGLKIRIRGKNKSYIATTDKNGVYELYDLPPGRYSVEPILKSAWEVDTYHLTRQPTRAELMSSDTDQPTPKKVWFTLRAGKHFGINFGLRLANQITGRVTTAAGNPLNQICVSLVPPNTTPLVCSAFTTEDGRFEIKSVKAGSYNLVINHENVKSYHRPFPTFYYPGVTNSEAAKVLTVKFDESIDGLNFVVPTSIRKRLHKRLEIRHTTFRTR